MKLHTIDLSERNATRSKLFLDERAQIKALEYAENFARVEAAARLLQQRLRARLSESISRRKLCVIMRLGKAHRAGRYLFGNRPNNYRQDEKRYIRIR
jgi:hypothetical protein